MRCDDERPMDGRCFFSTVGRRRWAAIQGDRSGEVGGAISPLRGETIQKSRSDFEWQDKACYTRHKTA